MTYERYWSVKSDLECLPFGDRMAYLEALPRDEYVDWMTMGEPPLSPEGVKFRRTRDFESALLALLFLGAAGWGLFTLVFG